jgi:2-phospho-L-lactate guanylyltransferase
MRAALVPVKRLHAAKSRLLPLLGRAALERLTLAMLEDVLAALRAAPDLDRVAVVTEDPAVAEAARAAGAEALLRRDAGLNPSLDAAAAVLAAEGARALLVVLGDVPGIAPGDVARLFAELAGLGGRGAVIAPARDGGTAALLRAPHDVIPSRFGPLSAAAHRALAREAGVPLAELALPDLALDLDRPEDVVEFLRAGRGGPRTRHALGELRLEAAC